jgi:hypothetical protein
MTFNFVLVILSWNVLRTHQLSVNDWKQGRLCFDQHSSDRSERFEDIDKKKIGFICEKFINFYYIFILKDM